MFHPLFRKSAVAAALMSLGFAVGVSAQSQSPASAPSSPPAAGSTGMDKGAGSATRSAATTPPSSAAPSAKPSATALSGGERRFLENAARGGMAEIETSKLAQQNAGSQQVKDFAKRLVDDHEKASMELKRVASAKGVTLPAEMEGGDKRKLDRLAKKTGTDFDKDYLDEMVDDHQKTVRDFRGMAKNAKDADVKAFAAATLPTLEQHLQMAKSAEDAVRAASRKGGATQTGAASSGTSRTTATPGKDTAATTGTAGPGTGMPASTRQQSTTAPQPPGGPADTRTTTPPK